MFQGGFFNSEFEVVKSLESYNIDFEGEVMVSFYSGTRKGDISLIPYEESYNVKLNGYMNGEYSFELSDEKENIYAFKYYFDKEQNTVVLERTNWFNYCNKLIDLKIKIWYSILRVRNYSLAISPFSPKGGVDMRNYEVMFIVRPNLEDEAANTLCESMKKVLEDKGATINEVVNMGRRELAYEVKKFNNGNYFLFKLTSDKDAVKEFDRVANINEDIIRHIVVKRED